VGPSVIGSSATHRAQIGFLGQCPPATLAPCIKAMPDSAGYLSAPLSERRLSQVSSPRRCFSSVSVAASRQPLSHVDHRRPERTVYSRLRCTRVSPCRGPVAATHVARALSWTPFTATMLPVSTSARPTP
jgi:hypothetical protein